MGQDAKKLMQGKDRPEPEPSNRHDQQILLKLRHEAATAGATLANGGKGGLPADFVLGVMRRDGYKCPACGLRKDLSLHHKGGIVESEWLSKKGHKLDKNNVTTICEKCHDRIHNKAREEGNDSSQVTPEGDVGNPRRDHGKPVAKEGRDY